MTQGIGETTAEPIRPRMFHETAGLVEWRVLGEGACAYFRTGSFAAGARFVQEIHDALGAADDHPDIDLLHDGVTVRRAHRVLADPEGNEACVGVAGPPENGNG